MRILFSAVPAYGHILPLAPLMQAAADAGHDVALATGAGTEPIAERELPTRVELLAVGSTVEEFLGEAARQGDGDPLRPTPRMVGLSFGHVRFDLDAERATAAARTWAPDVVIAETFDSVGPMLAAVLGVPWFQVGLGPALPEVLSSEIEGSAGSWFEQAGLAPRAPSSYIDSTPEAFQEPGWVSPAPVQRVRAQAHRRPDSPAADVTTRRERGAGDRPRVLVTFGTVFGDLDTLAAVVGAVAQADVDVVATLGVALPDAPAGAPTDVAWVPFAPLDELLDDVDLVVAAGGSGTVLGAMSRGVPLVLLPQGADQPLVAARAAAAGVAVVLDDVQDVTAAVARAVADSDLHERAAAIAREIAAMPSPAEVLQDLVAAPRAA